MGTASRLPGDRGDLTPQTPLDPAQQTQYRRRIDSICTFLRKKKAQAIDDGDVITTAMDDIDKIEGELQGFLNYRDIDNVVRNLNEAWNRLQAILPVIGSRTPTQRLRFYEYYDASRQHLHNAVGLLGGH